MRKREPTAGTARTAHRQVPAPVQQGVLLHQVVPGQRLILQAQQLPRLGLGHLETKSIMINKMYNDKQIV